MSHAGAPIEIRPVAEFEAEPEAGSSLPISPHGRRRQAQRGFRAAQVEYVIRHGTPIPRAGATFYVLRRRDLPPADRRDDGRTKLVGTVVVVEDGVVSTVYRNDRPFRHVLKKPKYDGRSRPRPMPLPLDPEPAIARPIAA